MSLEHSYSLLKLTDQQAALERIEAEIWDLLDRIAALRADRAALMNVMMGHLTITAEGASV